MRYRDLLKESPQTGFKPGFEQWFAGSKVVDKSGQPLVCYHGTFRDFAEFQYNDNGWAGSGFNRLGFWFDTDPKTPGWLAGDEEGYGIGDGGNIKPCYLSIKKPLVMSGDMIWNEDLDELRQLRKNVSATYAARRAAKNGDWNFGQLDLTYRDASRAFDAAMEKMMQNDGWTRIMRLLPNGIKSTTEEVAAFQAECIAEGYDGIHFVDTMADSGTRDYAPTDWWLAFHPNQIKSVFASQFNPQSTNMSEAQELDEIMEIPDFDDDINNQRRSLNWGEKIKDSKKVGKIGPYNLVVHRSAWGDEYLLLDNQKHPMGKATVSKYSGGFYRVGHIWFDPTVRGKGYGYLFYRFLIDKGMKVITDTDQTRFSRGVWSKLAREGFVYEYFEDDTLGSKVTDTQDFYGNRLSRLAAVKPGTVKESALVEKTIFIPDSSGMNFVVMKNPSKAQYFKLLHPDSDLKGLISGKDFYVWAAYHAHHGQIAHGLGLGEDAYRIFVRYNAILAHPSLFPAIRDNPQMKYLYGPSGPNLESE
jgi:hypothetical protein